MSICFFFPFFFDTVVTFYTPNICQCHIIRNITRPQILRDKFCLYKYEIKVKIPSAAYFFVLVLSAFAQDNTDFIQTVGQIYYRHTLTINSTIYNIF